MEKMVMEFLYSDKKEWEWYLFPQDKQRLEEYREAIEADRFGASDNAKDAFVLALKSFL